MPLRHLAVSLPAFAPSHLQNFLDNAAQCCIQCTLKAQNNKMEAADKTMLRAMRGAAEASIRETLRPALFECQLTPRA